ncbi:MAG TPA: sulfite reductase subunit alpha [Chthoniobacterales bacterium]
METVPFIPDSAPFTPEQRSWLNGFLAGWLSGANGTAPNGAVAAPAEAAKPLLILFGSQSGTAESIAKQVGKEASGKGYASRVVDLAKHETVDLQKESDVLVITSTWGEGDMPDNAQPFWERISSAEHPKLTNVRYSVLALGDKNYGDTFCQAGRLLDKRFEELGAARFRERIDCDVDYSTNLRSWLDGVWEKLASAPTPGAAAAPAPTPAAVASKAEAKAPEPYSRKNPFPARLLVNRKLNGAGSGKDTRHFEISLAGSGLTYEAGDALGVFPQNCPELVRDVLSVLGYSGDEAVPLPDGGSAPVREALQKNYDLRIPNTQLIQAVDSLKELTASDRKEDLKKWLWGREVIDVLAEAPKGSFPPAELVGFLRKLQPRLYSISSSPKAHPDEVHLTVARVGYDAHSRGRKGVCSTFLADRVTPDMPLPIFFQVSKHFRVPHNTDLPTIMVGPGTGIAPFRAFLEERQATGAKGKNWLFFGDQKASTDFLYQEQLMEMQSAGVLNRLDLAFSRDQAEKIYVQNRMLENGMELWKWLEEGAYFYVCGDASRMAKDVDLALHQVIETHGGMSAEAAAVYVAKLKSEKRYARDVY